MRGEAQRQGTLMLGLTPDGFVPKDHPLRRIKLLTDSALRRMSPLFDQITPPPRDARVDLRPRAAALPPGPSTGGQALLSRPSADREPQRADRRCRAIPGRPLFKPGAGGYAERDAALAILERSVRGPATVGADRAYDTRDFAWDLCGLGIITHVAQNERGRRSAIDGRTTRHPGYRRTQRRRKLLEEVFGWIKTVGAGGELRSRTARRPTQTPSPHPPPLPPTHRTNAASRLSTQPTVK